MYVDNLQWAETKSKLNASTNMKTSDDLSKV